MSAAVVDFATALLAVLNAGEYAVSFTAIRHYLVYLDRAQLKGLRVAIAPATLTDAAGARGGVADEEFTIWIGMQQAVKPDDVATIDSLLLVQQQIRDAVRLQLIGDASWVETDVPLLFLPDDLASKNQFTSVINVTFRQYRTP